MDHPVLGAVGEGVGDQIGQQLCDAVWVACDRAGQGDVRGDPALRPGRAQLLDDLLDDGVKFSSRLKLQRNASAQTPPREVEHIVDQPAHAAAALLHLVDDPGRPVVQRRGLQKMGPGLDRGQGIAQIMAQDGDELVPQNRGLVSVQQGGLAFRQLSGGVQVKGDQFGEQLEGRQGLGRGDDMRLRVDGAQGAEELAVGQDDRERDIALQAVGRRRLVVGVGGVVGDVVDHDRRPLPPDRVAQGGLERQFLAGLEAKVDLVAHRAGRPAAVGHAGDGGEAHARHAAHDAQDVGDRLDAGDQDDIGIDRRRSILM